MDKLGFKKYKLEKYKHKNQHRLFMCIKTINYIKKLHKPRYLQYIKKD